MNLIAHRFGNAAKTYDTHAVFQQEIAKRLLDRLNWFKINPKLILDIGSGTGLITQQLKQRYPHAEIIGVDFAHKMNLYALNAYKKKWWQSARHHFITGDAHLLPFKPHQFDLVISNCALQWCNPVTFFQEVKKSLKPEGLFLFATLGPDTLAELRQSFLTINRPYQVHPFIDMHHLGDRLNHSGLIDAVMDRENLQFTYTSLMQLCQDLKQTGANNIHSERARNLMTRNQWQQVEKYYLQNFESENKQLRATIEVIYGHAFHPKRIPTHIKAHNEKAP